jgi:hypothetical protein
MVAHSKTLCDTFRSQATWTWNALRQARAASCQLGEESLTDFNLLKIRTRHPNEVFTRTFTKPREAKTGADWEWWLTGPSRKWLGFRIQAKVIDLRTDTFNHLHYKTRTKPSAYQSDVLVNDAIAACPPRIPAYCLYMNVTNWRSLRRADVCGSYPVTARSFGCILIDARRIQQLRIASFATGVQSIMPFATPWHCLVCCNGYASGDLPERAHAFWVHRNQWDRAKAEADLPQLTDTPPSYVSALMQGESLEVPEDVSIRTVTIFKELDRTAD